MELIAAEEAVVLRLESGREDCKPEEIVGLRLHESVDSARNGIKVCLSERPQETTALFHGI